MNRLISVGLAIAVAPAILLLFGRVTVREDVIAVSELALFRFALPVAVCLILAGLVTGASKGVLGRRPLTKLDRGMLWVAQGARGIAERFRLSFVAGSRALKHASTLHWLLTGIALFCVAAIVLALAPPATSLGRTARTIQLFFTALLNPAFAGYVLLAVLTFIALPAAIGYYIPRLSAFLLGPAALIFAAAFFVSNRRYFFPFQSDGSMAGAIVPELMRIGLTLVCIAAGVLITAGLMSMRRQRRAAVSSRSFAAADPES